MQKQRVSRACDTCKRRKIRCTGKLPCAHCIKNNRTCEFKAAYTRGAVPEVQSAPVEEQEKYLEEVGYKRRQIWRTSPRRRTSSHMQGTDQDEEGVEEDAQDVEYDESTENDHQTHILPSQTLPTRRPQEPPPLTPASYTTHSQNSNHRRESNHTAGASPYERAQNYIHRGDIYQKNPIAAYGDPSFPDIDASFLIFPSESTSQALVRKYFDFVAGTNRILHQPTIEIWTGELLSNIRSMRTGAEENSKRAVILMVFALAHEYMVDECSQWDADTSYHYYKAAENQIVKETGEIRLATLQARLLQCLFLLSRSRINQCYSIFGTIVNLVYTIGIHRERRPPGTDNLLEVEMQKRVFWSVYITDKYLSSALGRPQMFHDEDIDQQLPLLVDDENLSSGFLQTTNGDAQSPMKGSIFQIRLGRIISNILSELYSIHKSSLESRFASASKISAALREWRNEIAHFLDLDPSLLSPLYRRQNMVLRLSYSQALILLHRPFLLDSVDNHVDLTIPVLEVNLKENVKSCLDAALNVVKSIYAIYNMEKSFNAQWFLHYCAYTAIAALFVAVINQPSGCQAFTPSTNSIAPGSSPWIPYFEAASKCQDLISNSTKMAKESFAQKCCVALDELRAEAVDKIRQIQIKETNGWRQSEEEERPAARRMREEGQQRSSGREQVQMGETSFFSGEWNDMNFDQSAPGGGVLYSIFNGVDDIRIRSSPGSLVDKIDRWGFSSLTGY